MQKEYTEEALEENKNLINEVIKSYVLGMKLIEIAKMYHITYYKARKILLDNNVRIRKKHEIV